MIDKLTKLEQLDLIKCDIPGCWHSNPYEALASVYCPECREYNILATDHIGGRRFMCTDCKYSWGSSV